MASIQVHRDPGGLADRLRSYEVVIDNDVVGRLRPRESQTFEAAPGSHELFVKIDWCRSEKLDVDLEEGQRATFHCAPRANMFTDLYWATFGRHRYVRLVRITV